MLLIYPTGTYLLFPSCLLIRLHQRFKFSSLLPANFTNGRLKDFDKVKFQLYQNATKSKKSDSRKRKLVCVCIPLEANDPFGRTTGILKKCMSVGQTLEGFLAAVGDSGGHNTTPNHRYQISQQITGAKGKGGNFCNIFAPNPVSKPPNVCAW